LSVYRSEEGTAVMSPDLATLAGIRQFTEELLERIAGAVGAERATLSRVDGESVVIEGSFDREGQPAELGRRWQITAPEFQRLIKEQEPMVQMFEPALLPGEFREQLAGVRHIVIVPLIFEGEVFATVAVSRRQDRPFADADLTSLRELGNVAVLALRSAMLLAESRAAASALRTSEERFRLLVDSVKDYAIFLLDPSGHISSWNQGAERIKGYRAEDIVGRHLSTFYQPEDIAAGHPAIELAEAEQHGRVEAEGWRVRKDGTRFWASVVITALRDDAGRLRGFAKVTRDITERKQIQDQLLESERRKSEFLKLASHELRTPVSLIRGYLSMFEAGDLGVFNERGKRALSVLEAQARELNALIAEMLEAARIEKGAATLAQEDLDLRTVAAEAVDSVRGKARADHRLNLLTPGQPLRVKADRGRLLIILQNLLDNAVKYSPDGGEIICEVREASGWAEVAVRDHGLGIEPEQLDQLFSRFGRIVTNETANIRGSGLGIYLARELARLQGGDIEVESEPGRGSAFTLRVPLASPKEQTEPTSGRQIPDPAIIRSK